MTKTALSLFLIFFCAASLCILHDALSIEPDVDIEPHRLDEQNQLTAYPAYSVTLYDAKKNSNPQNITITRDGDGKGAKLVAEGIRLLNGSKDEVNVVAFDQVHKKLYKTMKLDFHMRITKGGEGVAVALLNTKIYKDKGAGPFYSSEKWRVPSWEAPNLEKTFAVGFDISNPPVNPKTTKILDTSSNIYQQEEREIALHWDGKELIKRRSPIEFRDARFHAIRLHIRFEIGGAAISLAIDDQWIFKNYFIPEMLPYENRLAFAGRTSQKTSRCTIDKIQFHYADGPANIVQASKRVSLFAKAELTPANKLLSKTVRLPANIRVGRLIATVTLTHPKNGDTGTRKGAVYAWDEKGERFEILRFMTPFQRNMQWKVDVTDYQSLLRNPTKLAIYIDTKEKNGFILSMDLNYYPGYVESAAYRVQNLWVGSPKYGDMNQPFGEFFKALTINRAEPECKAIMLRITTTGHGKTGEFTPLSRTLMLNKKTFDNTLWKNDAYLNPLHPQRGPWQQHRAGWAPGAIVRPWILDISEHIRSSDKTSLRYITHPYKIEDPIIDAEQWIEAQIIYYKTIHRPPVIRVVAVLAQSQAQALGIQPGDYIVAYKGKRVYALNDILARIAENLGIDPSTYETLAQLSDAIQLQQVKQNPDVAKIKVEFLRDDKIIEILCKPGLLGVHIQVDPVK